MEKLQILLFIAGLSYCLRTSASLPTKFTKPISSFHYSENINDSYRQTSEIRGGKATFAWGMKHCLSMYTTKWFNFKEHFEYVKLNWIDIVHSTPMSIGLVHMVVSKIEYLGWYFRVQKLGPGQEHNQVLGTLLSCFTYYLLIFVVLHVVQYFWKVS